MAGAPRAAGAGGARRRSLRGQRRPANHAVRAQQRGQRGCPPQAAVGKPLGAHGQQRRVVVVGPAGPPPPALDGSAPGPKTAEAGGYTADRSSTASTADDGLALFYPDSWYASGGGGGLG